MNDSEFLCWLRDRLVFVYGEPESVDFVLRLGKIIKEADKRESEYKRPDWDYGEEYTE